MACSWKVRASMALKPVESPMMIATYGSLLMVGTQRFSAAEYRFESCLLY